jgi:hypothetical protein
MLPRAVAKIIRRRWRSVDFGPMADAPRPLEPLATNRQAYA